MRTRICAALTTLGLVSALVVPAIGLAAEDTCPPPPPPPVCPTETPEPTTPPPPEQPPEVPEQPPEQPPAAAPDVDGGAGIQGLEVPDVGVPQGDIGAPDVGGAPDVETGAPQAEEDLPSLPFTGGGEVQFAIAAVAFAGGLIARRLAR